MNHMHHLGFCPACGGIASGVDSDEPADVEAELSIEDLDPEELLEDLNAELDDGGPS